MSQPLKLGLANVNCACCGRKNLEFGLCCPNLTPRFFFSNLPFMFLDIDECNPTKPLHRCHQICQNINGSYNCSCQKGFNLVNGYRCEGIVTILLMFLQMISARA